MVGVGDIVEMDEKGRVVIPAEIRKIVGKTRFKVELIGKDTIVLRAEKDKRELVSRIAGIKLVGDRDRAAIDAAHVKDIYGGVRD